MGSSTFTLYQLDAEFYRRYTDTWENVVRHGQPITSGPLPFLHAAGDRRGRWLSTTKWMFGGFWRDDCGNTYIIA